MEPGKNSDVVKQLRSLLVIETQSPPKALRNVAAKFEIVVANAELIFLPRGNDSFCRQNRSYRTAETRLSSITSAVLDFCVCDFQAGSMFGRHPKEVQKKYCSVFFKLGALCALAQVVSCGVSQIFDGGLTMPFSI
jgi:hypothetical protein